jgi:hypothetical protein
MVYRIGKGRKKNIKNPFGEWFNCTIKEVKSVLIELKSGIINDDNRTLNFKMRPEQEEAVNKTISYFNNFKKENKNKTPHFLWNAKMRFGKTFATYQLANKMGWKKILVLTFKPAVQSAWEEDIKTHIDFRGWQFISKNGLSFEDLDKKKHFLTLELSNVQCDLDDFKKQIFYLKDENIKLKQFITTMQKSDDDFLLYVKISAYLFTLLCILLFYVFYL